MRIRHLLSCFLLSSVFVSGAYAADDNWSFSKLWVGAYPSSTVAGQATGLFAQPPILSALKQVLPQRELTALSQLTTESVVTSLDGFVIADVCRPHNCSADMATVVISPAHKTLWVGFFTRESARVSTRWYGGADDYSSLPEKIRTDFVARHTP